MLNFQNLDKMYMKSKNKLGIPEIKPLEIDVEEIEWIPFNYAISNKKRKGKGVHFYIDDYQFVRVWNNPDRYVSLLAQYEAVMTPDFSQYLDMPVALRIYNHYRKHWLGAYWQFMGINVIPTICWSDEESFEYCMIGEPKKSIISISSVGTQVKKQEKNNFEKFVKKTIEILEPKKIIWNGNVPGFVKKDIVIKIKPEYENIRRRAKNGR